MVSLIYLICTTCEPFGTSSDKLLGFNVGECTRVMHGLRSRITIDPRIPTMPGRSTSGFHRRGTVFLYQARNAVRCWASPVTGELHPTKNRFWGGLFLAYGWQRPMNWLVFWCGHVATSRGSNGYTMQLPRGARAKATRRHALPRQ